MKSIQRARKEWEDKTVPHPKWHFIGSECFRDEFRQYGNAIALVDWNRDYALISKLERLPLSGGGETKKLIKFLKSLAEEYHFRLYGQAVAYIPDRPCPEGPFLTHEELEHWYRAQGFKLCKIKGSERSEIWYPDIPPGNDPT